MCEDKVLMEGVRDYAEDQPVHLEYVGDRLVIAATNEGGYNGTSVDLLDVVGWLRKNKPEILNV